MTSADKKKRVGKACDNCRLRKTKCNGKKPCDKCLLDNKLCTFSERRREKEKHYPPGYLDLLETRCNLLNKSIVKLVELSLEGEDMSHFFKDVKYKADVQDDNDAKININKIIECLIQDNDLLKDEPIVWDEGTQIASRFDSDNAADSIKRFAEHSRKVSNCSSIASSSFMENTAAKIIDTHIDDDDDAHADDGALADNEAVQPDDAEDAQMKHIRAAPPAKPRSSSTTVSNGFPFIKKEGSPMLEDFPVVEEEDDDEANSPFSSASDEYNKILTRNNTVNSTSSWLDSSDFNSLFSINSNNRNSLNLIHNSVPDNNNLDTTIGNTASYLNADAFNADINSDFDMQFIKPKNMLFFEDSFAAPTSSMKMIQNNVINNNSTDLDSEILEPFSNSNNNKDENLFLSNNNNNLLITTSSNNNCSAMSPINSPISSPMQSSTTTPSINSNTSTSMSSLSRSNSSNNSNSPVNANSGSKKLGHVVKSAHHYHAQHNSHLNLNNHRNLHLHHHNNNNTNSSNSSNSSSISSENGSLHHHSHVHHAHHGHHGHYDEELSKILEDRLLDL